MAAVREAVARALAEDLLPVGDLSAMLVSSDARATAQLVCRAAGVLAGRDCAAEAFAQVDASVDLDWLLNDGESVVPGTVIATISGPLRPILTTERTALNFLCHLSGVASLTRSFVEAARAVNPTIRILDTRKTTPGLRALEKAAVRAGGGVNHRGSLSEGVLVKDNHLGGVSISQAVATAAGLWPGRLIEVECDRLDQVAEAAAAGASVVMCDNMSPAQVGECVALLTKSSDSCCSSPPKMWTTATAGSVGRPLVEVSGGVCLENVASYAAAGADLISVGALTHSAPSLDIGLDLVGS
ncbi:MAG: carboxylating nicotinate-nucleotide diphosphorylase [Acidimicrobiales bacterium]